MHVPIQAKQSSKAELHAAANAHPEHPINEQTTHVSTANNLVASTYWDSPLPVATTNTLRSHIAIPDNGHTSTRRGLTEAAAGSLGWKQPWDRSVVTEKHLSPLIHRCLRANPPGGTNVTPGKHASNRTPMP